MPDAAADRQLISALMSREEAALDDLLARGASPDAEDGAGFSALMLAAQFGLEGSLRRLIESGADLKSGAPLWLAAGFGHEGCVRLLIEAGVDVEARDPCGATPCFWAAVEGRVECLRMLIAAGCGLDAKDKRGRTACMEAARACRAQSVRVLIDAGADLEALDAEGKSAADFVRGPDGRPMASMIEGAAASRREAMLLAQACPTSATVQAPLRARL